MADYGCDPLWWDEPNRVGNIEPETLPLIEKTIKRLYEWSKVYNDTLNWDDPANSPGFGSEEAAATFEKEGISLWKQLQNELAPNYKVHYFSERLGKVVSNLSELEALL